MEKETLRFISDELKRLKDKVEYWENLLIEFNDPNGNLQISIREMNTLLDKPETKNHWRSFSIFMLGGVSILLFFSFIGLLIQ